ncbi:MAG: 3-isopropylmalate dehydratase small subunit, partial [Chrysiogenetes bacterium]|nr:3-isopropylmalate dehydratase small subunit [Chrysiogenetes bacterium]
MSLEKITEVAGKAVYVPGDDIDTDRIIPARFMKCVTFDGLGEYAFYDVRFTEDGKSKNHPLDKPGHAGAKILLSGKNFGCGSSREHAPQALHKFGIRAVIAESFAEIFYGNCTTLGIPCVVLSKEQIKSLADEIAKDPAQEMKVDVAARRVTIGSVDIENADIKDSTREVLVEGKWDPIGELLSSKEQVEKTYQGLPY